LILLIKGVSGWTWTNELGVNVTPAMEGTWEAFVARNPMAAQFRNKGWPYFDLMASIMPDTAKGTHVFRPGNAAPPPANEALARTSSPDWDEDEMERDFGAINSDDGLGKDDSGAGVGDEDEDEDNQVCLP
jgi:hypothetical protein